MRYAEVNASAPGITDVTSQVDDRFCTLRWRWPDGVQAVYIHKTSAEAADMGTGDDPPIGMKLYTREEYKSNNGYRDRLDEIGLISYTIFARLAENGETALVRQNDGVNRVMVSAGKARIYYSIQQKRPYSENKRPYIWRLRQKCPWHGCPLLCQETWRASGRERGWYSLSLRPGFRSWTQCTSAD